MRRGPSEHRRGKIVGWLLLAFVLLAFLYPFIIRSRPDYAYNVRQTAQFNSLDASLELIRNELSAYPPSDGNDPLGLPYCGAMKLAEAVMG